ncbi:MAG: T9SS type A sorting domain-containing protein [Calditrichaceae bacterium]|nr:choice-of-anchor J domain-containing protein [Calditrichia bacterium]NUQ41410.1 T9SS type A sorting domain-containing protein [Calditrichaceae bacterium]
MRSYFTISGIRFWYLLILACALMLLAGAGRAQPAESVLWSEDWEGNWIVDWHVEAGSWQVGTPSSGPNSAYNGQNCAATVLAGNYPPNANTRLIRHTSFIVPNANQNPRLRFWHWYSISSGDQATVQIKVGAGNWQTISETYTNTSSAVWTSPVIDLSAFSDSTVQIAFYFTSDGNVTTVSSGWYIDDVVVITGPVVFNNPETWETGLGDWYASRGTWEVGMPTSGPGSAYMGQNCAATKLSDNYHANVDSRLISPPFTVPGANQNPRLRFWHWYNISSGDQATVQIKVGAGNWQTISETYTNTGSAAWTYPFIDLSAFSDSTVQIAFYFTSDGNVTTVNSGWYIDDVVVITGPVIFNNPETWETGLGDWYGSRGTWEVGMPTSGPGSAHTGQNCAATKLGGSYHANVSSRLISPPFTIPAVSQNPSLNVWHWYSFSSGDAGNVQIKTEHGQWQTILGPFINTSGGVWSPSFFDLSLYADSTVQIAFYFTSDGNVTTVSSGWYIDDILIIGLSEVIASVVSPTYLPENCSVTAKLKVDMTRAALPNNLLGSFDGTLSWNPGLLQYTGNSGLLSGFSGPVNSASGQVTFSGANPNGAGGIVNILDVYFDVIGPIGSLDTLDLDFSSMAAASTSTNLLEILTLKDKPVALIEEGLLGDVTGDDLVNSTDALVMLSYDVGTALPQAFLNRITYGFGDVNFSGATNSTDALIVLSYDVGIPVPFPVGQLFCPPAPTFAPLLSSAKLPAGTGGEIIVSSLPVKGEAVTGNVIDVPLLIDMSRSPEKLGSFTVALEWNPAMLQLVKYTGGSAEGFETPVVNDLDVKNGKLTVANANPYGAVGIVNILNLQFKAVGEPGAAASVSASFSALAAAETFTDLLPSLEVSEGIIALRAEEAQPQTYAIESFPNPFNPSTEIRYQLPEAGLVEIVLYNVLGQKVQTLVNEHQQPGNYLIRWEGKNELGQTAPSGMYFLRMSAGKFVAERKLLLLK